MKTKALFLCLLLSLPVQSLAAPRLFDISFSDGRNCKKCTYEEKQGYIVSVKDAKGDEWLDASKAMTLQVYKSGFGWGYKNFKTPASDQGVPIQFGGTLPATTGPSIGTTILKAFAAGAGAYAATPRTQQLRNTSCHTYGSQTNCMSY